MISNSLDKDQIELTLRGLLGIEVLDFRHGSLLCSRFDDWL